MDSIAYFHDIAQGAAREIASLAVTMAVAEAVGTYSREDADKARTMLRQPVHFAWTAQSWGYAGSSRFLDDVKYFRCQKPADYQALNGGCLDPFVPSLRFKDFADANFMSLSLGGLIDPLPLDLMNEPSADPSAKPVFYLHGVGKSGKSTLRTTLFYSFGDSLRDGSDAVPPDASQSFAQYFPEAEPVSVANYETVFTNKVYHSRYDNVSLIPERRRHPLYDATQSLTDAAVKLCFRDSTPDVKINRTTVDSFIHCLTPNWTVEPCELAR